MMLAVFLASSILFGPPGPILHKTYVDSNVSADIAYRIAPDKLYGSGEAAVGPSIASGTLTYRVNGQQHRFDLATVLPITEHHIDLADSPRNSCGAAEALTRRGDYLVIEMYYGEKGCTPGVAIVELSSGTVVRRAAVDWDWDHRFDPTTLPFKGVIGVVERVDTARLRQAVNAFAPKGPVTYRPWTFRVIHWRDKNAMPQLLAYEVAAKHLDGKADAGADISPQPGEMIRVGRYGPPAHPLYATDVLVRPDAGENRRYTAVQSVTPPAEEHAIRRNEWLQVADQRAAVGDLPGAVQALEAMLDYEDDDAMLRSESETVSVCRAYIPIAAKQHLTKSAIATLWSNGCKPRG